MYLSIVLTSMQSPAIKNPTVLAGIFDPRGLIEILVSPPSSGLTSRASSSSLSFTKQSLKKSLVVPENIGHPYSAAWLKDMPVKVGERVSVYISHPVPWI